MSENVTSVNDEVLVPHVRSGWYPKKIVVLVERVYTKELIGKRKFLTTFDIDKEKEIVLFFCSSRNRYKQYTFTYDFILEHTIDEMEEMMNDDNA